MCGQHLQPAGAVGWLRHAGPCTAFPADSLSGQHLQPGGSVWWLSRVGAMSVLRRARSHVCCSPQHCPGNGHVPCCSSCRPAPQQPSASQAGEVPPWGGRRTAGQRCASCSVAEPDCQVAASISLPEKVAQGRVRRHVTRCRPSLSTWCLAIMWQVLPAQNPCLVPSPSLQQLCPRAKSVVDMACISGSNHMPPAQAAAELGCSKVASDQAKLQGIRTSEAAGHPTAAW